MNSPVRVAHGSPLRGTVRVPGDKSISHRALLLGGLARGWTRISGIARGADVRATIRAMCAFGVQMQQHDDVVIVHGTGREGWRSITAPVDCANSGTTMRLLMSILPSLGVTGTLTGDESLGRRPMRRIAEPLQQMGATIALSGDGVAPVYIEHGEKMHGIDYSLPIASAQLKTALLLAALNAAGSTTLRGRLDSRDHTERMLPRFGAAIRRDADSIVIEGGAQLRGVFLEVPGDPSSAAYWIAAGVLVPGSKIEIRDLCLNPTRTGFIRVLQRMGAHIETRVVRNEPEPVGTIRVQSSALRGVNVDAAEVPDLIDELPLLAVVATQADGVTAVRGAQELRVKESDRIAALAALLQSMGGTVMTAPDGFTITGPQPLQGGAVSTFGDHRMAMSAAIAALCANGETLIEGAQSVAVSYPEFFATLRTLGGNAR